MRIRTIKPAFWTSHDIAALPDDTHRLLFVGLWNYVDDEGREKDDPRLIKAALFPLNDAIRPADIDSMLWRLPSVVRYVAGNRPWLAITSWSEHQVISHKRPSSIPAPEDGTLRERATGTLLEPSGLEVEGKGREEERERYAHPPTADASAVVVAEVGQQHTEAQRANAITRAYYEKQPLSNFPAVAGIVRKAIRAKHADSEIEDALLRLAAEGRSVTTETLRIELEGLPERKAKQFDRAAEILREAADG